MTSSFHYFAYGSNLLSSRLKLRTPSARVVGPAVLEQHDLRWHKVGMDGSGKCDVVRNRLPDRCVLGVIYEIKRSDKPALDAAEALGVGYAEREVTIRIDAGVMTASLYYALQTDPQILPFDWYKALVIAGAQEHRLDLAYVHGLRAVVAKPDSDADRSRQHFSLADAG